jgi:hypothetical protein
MDPDDILDAFAAGDLGDVEFFELAMDAGIGIDVIETALAEARDDAC